MLALDGKSNHHFSFGVTSSSLDKNETVKHLIEKVDEALYRAKRNVETVWKHMKHTEIKRFFPNRTFLKKCGYLFLIESTKNYIA